MEQLNFRQKKELDILINQMLFKPNYRLKKHHFWLTIKSNDSIYSFGLKILTAKKSGGNKIYIACTK